MSQHEKKYVNHFISSPIRTTYKNQKVFNNLENQICYIPENAETEKDSYTRNDIVKLCNGDIEKAKIIFNICTWEFPETVLDQWDDDDQQALNQLKNNR